jgi:hypothetical protein
MSSTGAADLRTMEQIEQRRVGHRRGAGGDPAASGRSRQAIRLTAGLSITTNGSRQSVSITPRETFISGVHRAPQAVSGRPPRVSVARSPISGFFFRPSTISTTPSTANRADAGWLRIGATPNCQTSAPT